jgi:hypothetical protein
LQIRQSLRNICGKLQSEHIGDCEAAQSPCILAADSTAAAAITAVAAALAVCRLQQYIRTPQHNHIERIDPLLMNKLPASLLLTSLLLLPSLPLSLLWPGSAVVCNIAAQPAHRAHHQP